MSAYIRVRSSLVMSSLWHVADTSTMLVWLTMALLASKTGRIKLSVEEIARKARVTLAECSTAIEQLEVGWEEGPWLVRLSRGWRIVELRQYFRLQGARGKIPLAVRRAVWDRDGGRCVYCGSADLIEYDHIVPVVYGGGDSTGNVQLLCQPCNREKGPTAYALARRVS